MKQKDIIKQFAMGIVLLGTLMFSVGVASPAHADGGFLCKPSATGEGDVANCINRIYTFSIIAASLAAVFLIVIAGYLYMFSGGNESQIGTAKSLITSSIVGLVILLGGLLILKQINPELLTLKSLQPEGITPQEWILPDGTKVVSVKQPQAGAVAVAKERGQCTVANVSACSSWNPNEAVTICKGESSGRTDAAGLADPCGNLFTSDGKPVYISYGLFQINLKDSYMPEFPECSGVLTYTGKCMSEYKYTAKGTRYCPKRECTAPKGMAALQKCVDAVKDKARNIKQACNLFNKSCWNPWTTKELLSTRTCKK
jgi:hypothetical protein